MSFLEQGNLKGNCAVWHCFLQERDYFLPQGDFVSFKGAIAGFLKITNYPRYAEELRNFLFFYYFLLRRFLLLLLKLLKLVPKMLNYSLVVGLIEFLRVYVFIKARKLLPTENFKIKHKVFFLYENLNKFVSFQE